LSLVMSAVLRNHNMATDNVDYHSQKEVQHRYVNDDCGKENQHCPTESRNNCSVSSGTKKKNGNGKFKHKKKKQQQQQQQQHQTHRQHQQIGKTNAGQSPYIINQPFPGSSHLNSHNRHDDFHSAGNAQRQPRMQSKQKHFHQNHSNHHPHHRKQRQQYQRFNTPHQPPPRDASSRVSSPKSDGEFNFNLQDIPRVQYPFSNVRYPITIDMGLELDLRKIYRDTDAMLTDQACRQLSRM